MSNNLDITQGQAKSVGNKIMVGNTEVAKIHAEERDVEHTPSNWQARHNAALITEAFNVANEVSMTPRQLLEDREQLLLLITELNNVTDEYIKTRRNGGK